jgi:D-arabinose 1-dehydrogenase-like Zn-dependent alcohol dehydrogenase
MRVPYASRGQTRLTDARISPRRGRVNGLGHIKTRELQERRDDVQAWVVQQYGPIDNQPLSRIEREVPVPGPGQIRVRISCCGVCRSDLHLAEGDLPPRRPQVTPGHEVVGTWRHADRAPNRFTEGDRVGVAWLARTDQSCRYWRRGDEKLCSDPNFIGWDRDGGYAVAGSLTNNSLILGSMAKNSLRLSARFGIRATTHPYPMAHSQTALADLAHGRFGGAAVLAQLSKS